MALLKRITALGLSATLILGTVPALSVSAETESVSSKNFDYSKGEVTYYALGNAVTVTDSLISEQWALYNDGSFTLQSGGNSFDVYDNPYGTPSSPGFWQGPTGNNSYDGFFGGFFGGLFSGFSYRSGAITQTTAVAGVDINIGEAWTTYSSNSSSKEVIVAVIDTGVDYNHEDLSDSIWVNKDEIPANGIDDDGNGYIDDVYGWNFYDNNNKVYTGSNDDHGTHCAGTIAASSDNGTGVASVTGGTNVKVMVLKALGGLEGTGSTLSVVQAIKYAEANGASIVNLSLGSSYSDELLYNTIASSSMLFVIAAGNGNSYSGYGSNTDKTPCYPASYELDNIISVANISYDGNLHSSSNYGAVSVDLAAPGTYIISTTPNNDYGYMTGTSMSAPFVTAAAAMVYSYYDNITLSDVKDILINSVQKLDSLEGKTVSGGMLNVGNALKYDVSTLKHKEFTKKAATGTAPELSYTAYLLNNRIYILITATDADNDLYRLAYAEGEQSTEFFAFGSNGTEFELKNSSTATFVTTNYGSYTFYAMDSEGHETVLSVTLTEGEVPANTSGSSQVPGYSSGDNRSTVPGYSSGDNRSSAPGRSTPWYSYPGSSQRGRFRGFAR